MSQSKNYPIRKTGNVDNERVQINKALRDAFDALGRSDEWDRAVSWGDHNDAGYAIELTETEQFEGLGVPQNLALSEFISVSANGTERNTVEATWVKIPDDSIVYDLEIRQCDPATVVDANDPADILAKTDLFSVPIVSNEEADSNVTFQIFLEGDVRYWFRVRIRKGSLVSPWTDFENVTTSKADAQPDPPQSLTIEPIIEGAIVKWSIPADRSIIESTLVYRREVGQVTNPVVAEVAKPGNTFTDGDLDSSKTYEYKVSSLSFRDVESNPTGWISVQPLPVEADFVTPAVPANLSAAQELVTDNTGGQAFVTIDVSWDVVAGDNITYDLDIVRGGSVQVNTPVISNPATGSRVNYEFQVPVGTVLAIKVRSRNATSVSAFTATVNVTANADANAVGPVTNIVITPLYQGALINWDNPTNANFQYVIVERRQTAPGATTAYSQIGKVVRPSSFLFDDVGDLSLDANDAVENKYQYRLTGYSSQNVPGSSVETSVVTPLNIPEDSITANQIVARSITAQEIETGTLTANEITVGNLSSLSADLGTITAGNITLPSGGFIRSGQTAYDTGTGFFLGNSGGTPVFSLGNSAGNKILWNGSNFTVNGRIIDGQTNIVSGSINASDIVTGTLDASQATITNLNASNITTGTLSTNRLDTNVLLVGSNISNLTNDAGFTDFDQFDVQDAITNNVTVIDGGKITTGQVAAGNIDVAGVISAGSIIVGGDNISLLTNDAGFTDFDAFDVQAAIDNNVTLIDGSKITTGTIDASKISVTNLEAISTNTGTLTSNLIRTAATGQRLELTDPGTDATYAIWIGDSTKNDSNGVFWVKHNGAAFINKTDFDIQTGEVNVGAFSNANSGTTGDTFGNTLVASSGAIPVGSGGIKFEVNFFYNALKQSVQTAESSCPVGGTVSGEIQLLRNTSNTLSGATSVQAITFSSQNTRDWVPDSDPSLTPGVCTIINNTDNLKVFVDTGVSSGTYYYFVRFSQWNPNGFTQAEVNTNTLYVTWTTGN